MSPGAFDKRTLESRLQQLASYVTDVEKLATQSYADRTTQLALERALFLCTQSALDIATHVATSRGKAPEGYADAIDQLVNLHLLPVHFGEEFRKMAGFRNILVHGYANLDAAVVHEVANARLQDFRTFIELIRTASMT